jgi:hypothetical protein
VWIAIAHVPHAQARPQLAKLVLKTYSSSTNSVRNVQQVMKEKKNLATA